MTLALASFLALNAGQALATHVSCGDTITQDTTLDSDLIDCPSDGIAIGADNITLDLGRPQDRRKPKRHLRRRGRGQQRWL